MFRLHIRPFIRTLAFCSPWLLALPAASQTTLFSDNFSRADGPLDRWTQYAGTASIQGGEMRIGPTSAENWFWAGSQAIEVPLNARNLVFEYDIRFLAPGTVPVVGRHAGFQFCASQPTQRTNPNAFNGYFVDWIDRAEDRGLRLTRADAGALILLVPGQGAGAPAEPPLRWRIEVDDTNIRVLGDGVEYINFADSTYRGGFFGVWTWTGGQQVAYDNVAVTAEVSGVAACFSYTPPNPVSGSDVFFDGRCSVAVDDIASYSWDFGDGMTGSDETVEHTYAFGDIYTVTLTVEDASNNSDMVSRQVAVSASLLPFSDNFERAAGPVDGWTAFSGEWNITPEGQLETITTGGEAWVWAGSPAGTITGDFVAEFDMEFLLTPPDGVGRHAGFQFHCNQPTQRFGGFSGYFIDWIDRTTDHGIRLTRVDGGGLVELVRGAPGSPAEPPRRWRVEVEGPNIRVFGDSIPYIDIVEPTYRTGHAGFWAYLNAQDVLFDNVIIDTEIGVELAACFQRDNQAPLAGDTIAFDAGCSVAPEGVTITAYEWDFGDGSTGSGKTITHDYDVSDVYTVTLTVRAGAASSMLARPVTVYGTALPYSDDFERPDGPVSQWEVATGDWMLSGGKLVTGPTTVENWIWAAGSPAVVTAANVTFTYEYRFLAPGTNVDVGRHGGFQFHCNRPTQRYGAGFNGYFVDWIDRAADRGLRLTRVDSGILSELVLGQGINAPPEPPLEWRIEVDGDHIRVSGDGVEYIDTIDGTYRGGFFGFWTWEGGQEVEIDNLSVDGVALTPCFAATPALRIAGQPISFDASCSEVFGSTSRIVSYAWTFGDGASDSGPQVVHTYDFPDNYTVTLTVQDDRGNTRSLESIITVAGNLLPFADCFDREAGPVTGWTPYQGEWLITAEEKLSTMTPVTGIAADESWLWAGAPPAVYSGNFVAEYDLEFLANPMDGVGRHGGVMFYASAPTLRWGINGYTVWWIDRPGDFGIVIMRWDNGALTFVTPGTFAALPEPPRTWRIEVEGPTIRVFGDGTMYVEVDDETYREGYFGLWAYSNGQDVLFDNIRIGAAALPDCGGGPPEPMFVRGNANADASINITDGVFVLNFLFLGGPTPPCREAANTNGDGLLNLTDGIYLFNFLFLGGPRPPAPYPACASIGPTVDCASFPGC